MKLNVGGMVTAVRSAFTSGWDRVSSKFREIPQILKRIPETLSDAAMAVLRYRPSDRTWTVLLALLAIPLGGFLIYAPARELATGKDFGLEALLTLTWLATGGMTLAGGLGILFRVGPFHKFLIAAFAFSLPLPVAFIYRTFILAVKMRSSPPAMQKTLEPWVSGGVQVSLFFLAVSAFLFFMFRCRQVRDLSPGSVLDSRAGPVIGAMFGSAIGAGVGYLAWLLLRWLGSTQGIELFRGWVTTIPVDYFVAGAAFLGATILVLVALWKRRP